MDINVFDTLNMKDLGKKLQQARKQRGLTQADAAELIDAVRTTITAIEKGERRVKADELIRLARAYGRKVSDFVRPSPTVEPFAIQFRSSYKRTEADDKRVAQYIEEFETLCREYLELEHIVDSSLTYKYPPEYNSSGLPLERAAEALAQAERNRLGLGDGPVPLLRELLEQDVGLRIFYLDMRPSNKFSAMYAYDEQLGGCIAVNRLHPEERRRFSLAHDYAHFLAHRYKAEVLIEDAYQRRPESEQFADYFAVHFLMPTSGLTRRYNDIVQSQNRFTPADLCTLAHYYGVSVELLTRHMENLRLLHTGTWDKMRDSGFQIKKAQEALGLPPLPVVDDILPKRYQYLAVLAYIKEAITEGQLARFLRVDRLKARDVTTTLQEETDNILADAPLDLNQSGEDQGV